MLSIHFFSFFLIKTSQDPSSPLAGTSNQLSANLTMVGGIAERDGWDQEEWGSLEEEPVSVV
jgi:SCY1-like protein 1